MDVQVSNLVIEYGKHRALQGVSFQIGGGMYGLLGPNGAGKSTLMKVLATLLPPTSGTVTIGGVDVMKDPAQVRTVIGYLPQEFGFYKGLNAYELLDYIGIMKQLPATERKHQVEEMLDLVNLTSEAKRRVGGYSGGMKQRLGIAQALLGDPAVVIVDEPTAGLDPEERIRFRNLLARLSGHRTILLSTHIVADVEASCTGLAVMKKGKFLFNGSPEELTGVAAGQVWELEVTPAEYEDLASHLRVTSSRTAGKLMQIRVLAERNPFGRGTPVPASLEEGYLTVMQSGGEQHL